MYAKSDASSVPIWRTLDFIRNSPYSIKMVTYAELRGNQRRCLALTGLTPSEFDLLLPAFKRSWERLYPADRTVAGRPRQRFPGGGRTGALHAPEQKRCSSWSTSRPTPCKLLWLNSST